MPSTNGIRCQLQHRYYVTTW